MLISAFAGFLQANQTFPHQITAAIKGQTVRIDRFIDELVQGLINFAFAGAFREASGNGEAQFLKLVDVQFFT